MNRVFLTVILCIGIMGFIACRQEDPAVERILKLAPDNQLEIRKVFEHYDVRADSLKYKAALFLFQNMAGKYSYSGEDYKSFLQFIDSMSLASRDIYQYKAALNDYRDSHNGLAGNLTKVLDIETIKAEYVIADIDEAMRVFRNASWNQNIGFDEFCEYILPYRVGSEPLENFRTPFYERFKGLVFNPSMNMRAVADSLLKITSLQNFEIMYFPDTVPDFSYSHILKMKGGTCRESTDLALYIFRSLGIPVAEDFTPQWPHRGGGHSWTAFLDKDSSIDFEGFTANRVGGHLSLPSLNRMAKAYRHTYSLQPNSLAAIHGAEPIPVFFSDPCLTDVSTSYFKCVDVGLSIPDSIPGKNQFAYLCVFDDRDWVPIQWGRIAGENVVFSNMGKRVVYLPCLFTKEHCSYFGDPLLIDSNGNKHIISVDPKTRQKLVLKRKYPILGWWSTRTLAMVGGYFQAANRSDFSDAVNLASIRSVPEMTYQTIALRGKGKYRYWRYIAPDNYNGDIAELEFCDAANRPIVGKVIGTEIKKGKTVRGNAFDGDPLTYFQGDSTIGNWVGLDLGKEVNVAKIRYLPRNDDNFIERNESYELYYWSDNTWKSLGKKIGDSTQVLEYSNVPVNALYLLRNLSKGREERIFTYENGKQVWW